MPENTQLTSLLTNDEIARLQRMRISSARRFTNKSRGEHLSGKGGRSIDFSDYRDYAPGDDLRFVDWNIFSRLHRPFTKLYYQEEEMHMLVLIDASSSMDFSSKFTCARKLAAAFSLMAIFNSERLSIYAFNSPNNQGSYLPPCTGRASMKKIFRFLEELKAGGEGSTEQAIEDILTHHRGRGSCIILSDFLSEGNLKAAFNRLTGSGLEIMGLQIMSNIELDPELNGDVRLLDSEIENTLDVSSVNDLLEIYHEYRITHQQHIENLCRQRGGKFASICSETALQDIVFQQLLRKGWIK